MRRAQLDTLLRRLHEPRRFLQILAGPRQVGKTTALLSLGAALTAEGRYAALLVSMETGAAFPDDVGAAEHAILAEWRRSARHQLPADLQPPPWPDTLPGSRIGAALDGLRSAISVIARHRVPDA